jgi:alcohol dehydrogenase class IV
MTAEIQIPSIMKIGGGAFAETAPILTYLGCKRTLIVTDAFLMSRGLPEQLRQQIEAAGIACGIFSDTVPDPTTDAVAAGVKVFLAGGYDSLVSLGGGSPIDTAKAIDMLAVNTGKCREYKVPNPIPNPGPPHVAIPTTAGTGSEVTRFTVITDSETDEKMLIAGRSLLPTAAVVDYELTMTMPKRLTADTGTDSLTHAIEAYVSRRANLFTDSMALAAMKTIWDVLPIAFNEPDNRTAREAMMLAATMAGIAFSNSSVALVHGMSRPIGAHFHVPHGLSNAMLLPEIVAFSVSAAPVRYAQCARAMGLATAADEDSAAIEKLIAGLFKRNAELQVPSPKAYGIAHEHYHSLIPKMAAQALASGSPQNNPRVPDIEEICELYRKVFD